MSACERPNIDRELAGAFSFMDSSQTSTKCDEIAQALKVIRGELLILSEKRHDPGAFDAAIDDFSARLALQVAEVYSLREIFEATPKPLQARLARG